MTRKHHEITVSSNGVATLTIANAGKANILGSAVIKDLTTSLDALGQDQQAEGCRAHEPWG